MNNDSDDFIEFDSATGVVKCPYCGADVPCSLFFDDKVECPTCGKAFKM